MWSDIETSKDLLGYAIHASLLKDIVTNPKNLPITVGLYGDWGSGKSSILKILQGQLEKEDDTVVVYFDGWSFESFDDAKMALIQGIVDSLEQNEKFFAKIGDKTSNIYIDLKDAFKELRKSIGWMRLLKISAGSILPIATAAFSGGSSLIIPTLLSAFEANKGNLEKILTGDSADEFLRKAIKAEDEEKKYVAVREFRNDFAKLIDKSKQGKIVILIDDLDRCLPRHIIDNLEAIKLFLNVPKTAFIIAADEFIVSNAVKSEYKSLLDAASDERNHNHIGNSYMEKFIQLPYKIPGLSPKEVETYITLLFCKSALDDKDFEMVQSNFAEFVSKDKFDKYGWENIQGVLKDIDTRTLSENIGFVSHFSTIIGNSLRWNPRLIKRFLNAFEVRFNLLVQSGINDSKNKFALLKLMLIEQKYIGLFRQFNDWTMTSIGTPKEITELEAIVDSPNRDFSKYKEWNTPDLINLISIDPKFSSVDMKVLFWVSRDNIVDEMSGMALISSRVKSIFNEAYEAPSDPIRKQVCNEKIKNLSEGDQGDIFDLIDSKLLTSNGDRDAFGIYFFCIMNEVPRAYNKFLGIISRIDAAKIPFSLGNKFKEILHKYNNDNELLEKIKINKQLLNSIYGK